jgi:hypothetical protein
MAGSPLRYSDIRLPIQERRSSRAAIEGDRLRLVIEDPNAPGEPDEFDMMLGDPGHASLQYVGIPVAPLPFARHSGSSPAPVPAFDWEPGRTYSVDAETVTPNAEMARIYDEDQKVRQNLPDTREGWFPIERADRERRGRVTKLLEAGALHTPGDYRKAAFVFQHGDQSDDYLLAHTLALVAVTKGDSGSAWIAAASLDRYLQSIRQPQIYGTQFQGSGKSTTQGAYNQRLISDLLRTELSVPTMESQALQLKSAQSSPSPGK